MIDTSMDSREYPRGETDSFRIFRFRSAAGRCFRWAAGRRFR